MKDPILIIEDAVSKEFTQGFINFVEQKKGSEDESALVHWSKASGYINLTSLMRDKNTPDKEQLMDWDQKLYNVMHDALMKYVAEWKEVTVNSDGGYNFRRYEEGTKDDYHYDITDGSVTMIFYFNDNFEGGETEFKYKNKTIKPKAGTIIVFPASHEYVHKSTPITKGVKYVVETSFFYEAPKDDNT
jgi:hypothetical protein